MWRGTSFIIFSFIQQPGLVGRNWLLWRWSLLWLECHLEGKKVKRVANIYRELGSWAWGCRSRLHAGCGGCRQAGSGMTGVKLLRWWQLEDGLVYYFKFITYRSFNTCLNLCTQHTLLSMLMSPVPPYENRWPTWKLYRNLQILHKAAIMISTMTEATP